MEDFCSYALISNFFQLYDNFLGKEIKYSENFFTFMTLFDDFMELEEFLDVVGGLSSVRGWESKKNEDLSQTDRKLATSIFGYINFTNVIELMEEEEYHENPRATLNQIIRWLQT